MHNEMRGEEVTINPSFQPASLGSQLWASSSPLCQASASSIMSVTEETPSPEIRSKEPGR